LQALQGHLVPCDNSRKTLASTVSSLSFETPLKTITTYNRFSLWEEEVDTSESEEIEIEDLDMVRLFSDKKQTRSNKCKQKTKNKVQKLKHKKSKLSLAKLKTENKWSVFQDFTEAEIGSMVSEEYNGNLKDSKKRKCRKCGYKKTCHMKSHCKSNEKNCYACQKSDHFPKSQDCKIKKKRHMHSIKSKPIQSCITLRQFLKMSGLKIRTGAIPFKNQTGRTTDMTEFEKDIKIASSPLNENTIKAIEDKIAVL
jgi:hypothetical protein